MSNAKISITAEFVSIMRAEQDPRHRFFVSPRGQRLYAFTSAVLSKKLIREIFRWRLALSAIFDEKIANEHPQQVIELAAGYSLRGLTLAAADPALIYIEVDLPEVIERKKTIIEKICAQEKQAFPTNLSLISSDVLSNDLVEMIMAAVAADQSTLVIAEGLTSYFSEAKFAVFLGNIRTLLARFNRAEFYTHENIAQPQGLVYRLLREWFVARLTRSAGRKKFDSADEFIAFLNKHGIDGVRLDTTHPGYLFYSISHLSS